MEVPVFALYAVVTVFTAAALAYGAYLDLVGHESIGVLADRIGVPRSWMAPLGVCLGAGALGLLVGLAVPVVGTAAGAGLILYFLAAVGAHLRVGDRRVGGAVGGLALSVAVLVLGMAVRGVA
ncbi:DoxX family protein [Streptomyces sp. NPDC047821]|uniref:DoxX family protein n=1 Tax=Streptomyces sp. NPDC047821 TaxID=3365488 RepID=UPI0037157811